MKFVFLLFTLLLSACASTGRQTLRLMHSPPEVAPQAEIKDISFIKQTGYDCGPSTLAMAMNFADHIVETEQIKKEVYTPKKKGTLPIDLISYTRQQGLLAIQINDLSDLIKELDSGHPVIALENLGFSWYAQWHYILLTGYNLTDQRFIYQSGETPNQKIYFNHFERNWELGDHWAIVVLPPDKLSTTGNELAHLKAASGLEMAGKDEGAKIAYQTILSRWNKSLGARIGLANIFFREKNISRALTYLNEAAAIDPQSNIVKHNIQVAQTALENSRLTQKNIPKRLPKN